MYCRQCFIVSSFFFLLLSYLSFPSFTIPPSFHPVLLFIAFHIPRFLFALPSLSSMYYFLLSNICCLSFFFLFYIAFFPVCFLLSNHYIPIAVFVPPTLIIFIFPIHLFLISLIFALLYISIHFLFHLHSPVYIFFYDHIFFLHARG